MRKAGGIIALIAGILGFFAAIFTLFVGGVGSAFSAQDADTVVLLGWGGVFFSFAVIVLGAVQIGTKSKITSILLISSSIAGIILGGTFVAICLALSFIGGILGMFEKSNKQASASENTLESRAEHNNNSKKTYIAASIAVVVVVLLLALIGSEENGSNSQTNEYESLASNNEIRAENYEPTEQKQFVNIINEARAAYNAASNDMAKGGIRSQRKDAICRFLKSGNKENWVGVIESLGSNSEGKGVLSVAIGDDIKLETWNNALSDISSNTLINTKSDLFQTVSKMQEGDQIVFSGTFFRGDNDCVEEQSFTLNGSLSSPSFTFKFYSAMPLEQYVQELSQQQVQEDSVSETLVFDENDTSDNQVESKEAQDLEVANTNENSDENNNENVVSEKQSISVIKQTEKSGFLTREVSALLDVSTENSANISLKNGTEVNVTGKTSDQKYYEISTKIMNQSLFVPIDSVALFGN